MLSTGGIGFGSSVQPRDANSILRAAARRRGSMGREAGVYAIAIPINSREPHRLMSTGHLAALQPVCHGLRCISVYQECRNWSPTVPSAAHQTRSLCDDENVPGWPSPRFWGC